MSGLIKADATRGRVLDLPGRPVPPTPVVSASDRELAAARAEQARLLAEVDRLSAMVDAARIAGYKDGAAQGERVAGERADRTLEQIRATLTAAQDAWTRRLDRIEHLAITLANAAVHKILGVDAHRKELAVAALRERLRPLRGDAIVSVRVSAHDISDADTIALGHAVADRVVVDATLPSGTARIDLALGRIDAGLLDQLAAFDRLCAEGAT